jgi:predicted esterase
MSLKVGLEVDKKLGGIIAFSGFYFPNIKEHENNKNTPILISHG